MVAASSRRQPAAPMISATSSISREAEIDCTSMDLRLGGWSRALEEVEVAAGIGLGDVSLVERSVTALVARLRFSPRRATPCELLLAHLELQPALGHIELEIGRAHV